MIGDDNRFFKFVWRFNALFIAGLAVLGALAILFSLVNSGFSNIRNRHVTDVVNVDDQADIKNEFILGYPDELNGTDYVKISLVQDQSYSMNFYSGKSSGGNQVNYLFVNSRTGESKWLLPTVNQLITYVITIADQLPVPQGKTVKVKSLVYAVVEKDTDGDKRLTQKDALTIATSAVDGSGYKTLVGDISRLYTIKQIASDRLMLLYQKNGATISEIYELPSMKKISENPIPKIKME